MNCEPRQIYFRAGKLPNTIIKRLLGLLHAPSRLYTQSTYAPGGVFIVIHARPCMCRIGLVATLAHKSGTEYANLTLVLINFVLVDGLGLRVPAGAAAVRSVWPAVCTPGD